MKSKKTTVQSRLIVYGMPKPKASCLSLQICVVLKAFALEVTNFRENEVNREGDPDDVTSILLCGSAQDPQPGFPFTTERMHSSSRMSGASLLKHHQDPRLEKVLSCCRPCGGKSCANWTQNEKNLLELHSNKAFEKIQTANQLKLSNV